MRYRKDLQKESRNISSHTCESVLVYLWIRMSTQQALMGEGKSIHRLRKITVDIKLGVDIKVEENRHNGNTDCAQSCLIYERDSILQFRAQGPNALNYSSVNLEHLHLSQWSCKDTGCNHVQIWPTAASTSDLCLQIPSGILSLRYWILAVQHSILSSARIQSS